MSEKCQSCLCICCWQPPSLMQCMLGSAPPLCLLSPGQIGSSSNSNCKQHQRGNRATLPTSNRRNKKTDKEKQCKKEELDTGKEFAAPRIIQFISALRSSVIWFILILIFLQQKLSTSSLCLQISISLRSRPVLSPFLLCQVA